MNRRPGRREVILAGAASAAAVAAAGSSAAAPAASRRLVLWPSGSPEAHPPGLVETFVQRAATGGPSDRILKGVTAPFVEIFSPEPGAPAAATGASILIMPGGGYRYMAWDKEGDEIARWFASRGVAAFVLGYRLPNDGWTSGPAAPLADAQRAVRLIRANAAAWGLDPGRIAAIGFSAGGHLCASLAARREVDAYRGVDAADRHSYALALAAPVYPAIDLSRLGAQIFGKDASLEQVRAHSPHLHVTEDSPPHFLLHCEDDPLVDAQHSLLLRGALRDKGVRVETHLYAQGGHGFGIRLATGLPLQDWPERLMAFGRTTGWLN